MKINIYVRKFIKEYVNVYVYDLDNTLRTNYNV